jgi:hypothetical protein
VQRYKNSAKSFCVAAKNGINMRILTKMSCSYSDNRMNERIKAKHCQGKRFANYVDYIGTIMHSKLIILNFQSDKKEQQRLANKIILSEKTSCIILNHIQKNL